MTPVALRDGVDSAVAPPPWNDNQAILTYGDTWSIAPFADSFPSAWVPCTIDGVQHALRRSIFPEHCMRRRVDIFRHLMTTVLTISLPTTTGLHLPPLQLPTLLNQLLQPDATMTTLCIFLPPLNPAAPMRASRQVGDNIARPSIDNFEREPGRQPGVLLLPLHSTLLPPKSLGTTDATPTLIISLPPFNPPLQCASREDEDNDCVSARPCLNHDTRGIELRDYLALSL